MLINPKAKLLAALDHAEEYRVLAIRSRDRGERESYERVSWVSLIMCTGGAYRPFLQDRHLALPLEAHETTEHQREGVSITLQFVRPDIRQSCNLLWTLSA